MEIKKDLESVDFWDVTDGPFYTRVRIVHYDGRIKKAEIGRNELSLFELRALLEVLKKGEYKI